MIATEFNSAIKAGERHGVMFGALDTAHEPSFVHVQFDRMELVDNTHQADHFSSQH